MRCPDCRHENPAEANFCQECGTSFAVSCGDCGVELPPTAKFCHGCGRPRPAFRGARPSLDLAPRDYTPRHLAEKILQSKSVLEGERKQVTVLFADVKGSMGLAEQVDPEEWHRILDRFFQILASGVHRFEGTVNQYTGDGIMALFGAPIAHEDDAQRACYAALRLWDELRRYAGELAAELLRLARETRDPAQLLVAHRAMGTNSYWHGALSQAREHLEEGIARYDPQDYRAHEYLTSPGDPGITTLVYLSFTLWGLGYPDQASRRSREAIPLARELRHPFSQAYSLFGSSNVHLLRGELQAALEEAEALIALASEHGFLQLAGIGTFYRAVALVEQGHLEEVAGMRAVLEALPAAGRGIGSPYLLVTLAEAHRKAGQAEEGLALAAEALEFVAKTGERLLEARVHREKGELLLARSPSDPAGAEAAFREALEIARRQSAKSPELRAAMSLARLWQRQGRKQEAHALLAPVTDWFTEGFETRDLKDAKALLEELA